MKETPWDERVYGIKTYEIERLTEEALDLSNTFTGHFTIKVNPLVSKKALHQYDFYYCDTLIEPFCSPANFKPVYNKQTSLTPQMAAQDVTCFCKNTFQYDRFHRDFNLEHTKGDSRYAYWLEDIIQQGGEILGLNFQGELVGFFAYKDNHILLHAIGDRHRGRGLAKYLWSDACNYILNKGWNEIKSSISAANLAVLNLYRSLGFSFRHPVDIYHKYNVKEC
nr:GNAT family N-acetyltransferase [Pullulanibacillus pueri]